MTKLILNIKERLGIGSILNRTYQAGGMSLSMLTTAQKIIRNVIVDEKEQKKIGWKVEKENIGWDMKKDVGKEIEFSEDEKKLIIDIIKRKDESKEFGMNDTFILKLAEMLDIKV